MVSTLLFAFFVGAMGCAAGGVASAVAGGTVFRLAGPHACPDAERAAYECRRQSYHQPGECEPRVTCTAPDGRETNATPRALLVVLGASFTSAFVPALLFRLGRRRRP